MTDQQRLADIRTMEKKLTGNYDTFSSDCTNLSLRNEMLKALARSHNTQTELLLAAQERGWSKIEAADEWQMEQAKKRFFASCPV